MSLTDVEIAHNIRTFFNKEEISDFELTAGMLAGGSLSKVLAGMQFPADISTLTYTLIVMRTAKLGSVDYETFNKWMKMVWDRCMEI